MTGIVIVTWNSAEVIATCLAACERLPDAQIVVVDNASSDGTVDEVRRRPSVRLLASNANLGFAGGVNLGISQLDGCEAVLVLNPDAAPVQGWNELIAAATAPQVGAAAGKLIDYEGRPQEGFNIRGFPTPWTLAFETLGINRIWASNPVNRRYRIAAPANLREVEQPAAAFLMVNRRAWEAVGGLDEGFYPLWFEDVDFCWRLREAGYRILYVPQAVARHIGGHSATRLGWDSRQVFWYGSLLRYACRRFSWPGRILVAWAVMAASVLRGAAAAPAHGLREAARVYSEVFRLGWNCWRNGALLGGSQPDTSSRKKGTDRALSQ